MQRNRSRGGNSFQERDSEGRFTSSNSRRGRYGDNYNYNEDDRDYDRNYGGQTQYNGYGYDENDYDDYPQGRNRGYQDDEADYDYNNGRGQYQNENEDQWDDNYGGSYRESYGRGGNERNYSNQQGGWDDDRSGYERRGYGRNRSYDGGYGHDDDYSRGRGWNQDRTEGRRNRTQNQGNSNGRGFASMDRDQVRELGRRGGEASHGGRHERGWDDNRSQRGQSNRSQAEGTSNRCFASMPKSEVRRIASMGGSAPHNRRGRARVSERRRRSSR